MSEVKTERLKKDNLVFPFTLNKQGGVRIVRVTFVKLAATSAAALQQHLLLS